MTKKIFHGGGIVAQTAKEFASKLNKCLDETGAPAQMRERSNILSKMLDIPKHQAWGLLDGQQLPEQALLHQIAEEFERIFNHVHLAFARVISIFRPVNRDFFYSEP